MIYFLLIIKLDIRIHLISELNNYDEQVRAEECLREARAKKEEHAVVSAHVFHEIRNVLGAM